MMDDEVVAGLLDRPKEALSVELKAWFDPSGAQGQAKLIKGTIALRNNGGGYMLIGIHDDGSPDDANVPTDVAATFDPDKIQGLVSRFAAELFEIDVSVRQRDGRTFVVIAVPGGVTTPCATKRNIAVDNRDIVKTDAIYVRTLSSNGTVSSAEARHGDWSRITRICFDNREADIGQFIRRHISSDAMTQLRDVLSVAARPPPPTAEEQALRLLDEGVAAQDAAFADRKLDLPPHGRHMVAAVIGERNDLAANQDLLSRLFRAQPQYTGWPAWIDSRGFQDPATHPYVKDGRWNAVVFGRARSPVIEYWSIDPRRGQWFLSRALEDDVARSETERLEALDFGLPIRRTTEALAVLREFALALDYPIDSTNIGAAFRWTRLKGRYLTSWAHPSRHIVPRGPSHDDTVQSFVSVPLSVGPESLGPHVHAAVAPLHRVFDGFELHADTVDGIAREVIRGR